MVKYARAIENCLDCQIETLYSIMDGKAEAMEFKVLDDFKCANVSIKDMRIANGVLIAGISRNKETFIPTGDDVILPGDTVIIIAEGKRVLSLSDVVAR
jgi:trk system potassium uptake protein TrkA